MRGLSARQYHRDWNWSIGRGAGARSEWKRKTGTRGKLRKRLGLYVSFANRELLGRRPVKIRPERLDDALLRALSFSCRRVGAKAGAIGVRKHRALSVARPLGGCGPSSRKLHGGQNIHLASFGRRTTTTTLSHPAQSLRLGNKHHPQCLPASATKAATTPLRPPPPPRPPPTRPLLSPAPPRTRPSRALRPACPAPSAAARRQRSTRTMPRPLSTACGGTTSTRRTSAPSCSTSLWSSSSPSAPCNSSTVSSAVTLSVLPCSSFHSAVKARLGVE